MMTLHLPYQQTARVWRNEYTLPVIKSETFFRSSKVESRGRERGKNQAVIELSVPRGGRYLYGLLGGTIKEGESETLSVDIAIDAGIHSKYQESLISTFEQVYWGLPEEFAENVCAGIRRYDHMLPHANMLVNYSAHGLVSSCGAIFEHLGFVLCHLLNDTEDLVRDKDRVEKLVTFGNSLA